MCGLRNAHFLARCLECDAWFCNCGADEPGGSHIYRHLAETLHGAFLFPDNGAGAHKPACERCGCASIPKLGVVPGWDGARITCLDCFDYAAEAGSPTPLVAEKRFSYEILPWPTPGENELLEEASRAPSVTVGQDVLARLKSEHIQIMREKSAEFRANSLRTALDWLPVAGLRFGPAGNALWKTAKAANGYPLVARGFRPRLAGFDPDVRATRTGVSGRTPGLQSAISRLKARAFDYADVYSELLRFQAEVEQLRRDWVAVELRADQPALLCVLGDGVSADARVELRIFGLGRGAFGPAPAARLDRFQVFLDSRVDS